jgi:hypothetical protein
VYEYLFNLGPGSAKEILNFISPWSAQKNNNTIQSFEDYYLPNREGFRLGRVLGSGAAILQGLNELLNGGRKLVEGISGLVASLAGGPPMTAVGTGSLVASAAIVAHGAAVVSSGGKRFIETLQDLYERSKARKEIENRDLSTGETLTPQELGVAKDIGELKTQRKQELKEIQKKIDDLKSQGTPDDSEELLEARYDRYLLQNIDKANPPLPPDQWRAKEGLPRQNRSAGELAQESVLQELGVPDNNKAGSRISYTQDGLGSTIPDGVTSKAWIDVKSVNTQDGVQSRTSQLRIQELGARREGKQNVVIMTGKNPARPSQPLADNAIVIKFDESAKTWSIWNDETKSWGTRSSQAVKALLGI